MKELDVDDIDPNITYDQAVMLHNTTCDCKKPYIVEKPLGNVRRSTIWTTRVYAQKCWYCFECQWESETITTRII